MQETIVTTEQTLRRPRNLFDVGNLIFHIASKEGVTRLFTAQWALKEAVEVIRESSAHKGVLEGLVFPLIKNKPSKGIGSDILTKKIAASLDTGMYRVWIWLRGEKKVVKSEDGQYRISKSLHMSHAAVCEKDFSEQEVRAITDLVKILAFWLDKKRGLEDLSFRLPCQVA